MKKQHFSAMGQVDKQLDVLHKKVESLEKTCSSSCSDLISAGYRGIADLIDQRSALDAVRMGQGDVSDAAWKSKVEIFKNPKSWE